ncbi:MAG: ATPase, partial [Eubacteriales bacterium]|nr:ATPase [Eubacteriales bacterium]
MSANENRDSIFTIFAGVNGSGKTSLYAVLKNVTPLGDRVNIDEIAINMGSWRDALTQVKAGREAIK